MYLVTVNGTKHASYPTHRDALLVAAELDFCCNSTELNNGVAGNNIVQITHLQHTIPPLTLSSNGFLHYGSAIARWHWPLYSNYISISLRDGSTTKILTLDEFFRLIT